MGDNFPGRGVLINLFNHLIDVFVKHVALQKIFKKLFFLLLLFIFEEITSIMDYLRNKCYFTSTFYMFLQLICFT